MPTRRNTNFPLLTDDNEFEDLIGDICSYDWADPNTQRFGRSGQKQFGVDIYGQPAGLKGIYRAAQCKLRKSQKALTEKAIEDEVAEAKKFPHSLDMLVIVTDHPRDTNVQIIVDKISEREQANGSFKVIIWFWDTIIDRLATYPRLIVRYYKDYYATLTTLPLVEGLVNIPLQIVSLQLASSNSGSGLLLDHLLKLRGIRITAPTQISAIPSGTLVGAQLPDGVLCDCSALNVRNDSEILKITSLLLGQIRDLATICPVFVLTTEDQVERLIQSVVTLDGTADRLRFVFTSREPTDLANSIFDAVFSYGHPRRGGFTTIEIAARSFARQPDSALLDMDWQHWLSPTNFPSREQWEAIMVPALHKVSQQVLELGSNTRIQINSGLQLPAAVALGFYFNIRVARVGVWARQAGISDFKRQFWLSDGTPEESHCSDVWSKNSETGGKSAIVELATMDIHSAVQSYAEVSNLEVDLCLQVLIKQTDPNIEEGQALAIAEHVAKTVRRLNTLGVTDIHFFARIPSALGVLIGQRLLACGSIHLYWFENPASYRYAFTLQ